MKLSVVCLLIPCLACAAKEENFSRPPVKEITVEAQPWVKNCMTEPYLVADFIYWKVKQDGLEYAASGFGDESNPVTSRGKVYAPDLEGKPGFRLGLGFNIAHDGWDALLRYTWIDSHVGDRAEGDRLVSFWSSGSNISRSKASWDIHMDVIDLEWGRNFYISRFLTLRPFFGLKGYWSNQQYRVRELGNLTEHTLRIKDDNWGIGIRFGMDTAWYLVRNWSVFASFSIAPCWSNFDIRRKDSKIDRGVGLMNVPVVNTRFDDYFIVPILEIASGVRWEVWFDNDNYHALIQAGWEEQIWWGMNRFPRANAPVGTLGNLQFQGLTLKFRFDF